MSKAYCGGSERWDEKLKKNTKQEKDKKKENIRKLSRQFQKRDCVSKDGSVSIRNEMIGSWYGLCNNEDIVGMITENEICGNPYKIIDEKDDKLVIDVLDENGYSNKYMFSNYTGYTIMMYCYNNLTCSYTGCRVLIRAYE